MPGTLYNVCASTRKTRLLGGDSLGWYSSQESCFWFGKCARACGRVRNVVLMNVYLDLGNPGGSGFWVGGYMSQVREMGKFFLTQQYRLFSSYSASYNKYMVF
jgi:hypothetical protein